MKKDVVSLSKRIILEKEIDNFRKCLNEGDQFGEFIQKCTKEEKRYLYFALLMPYEEMNNFLIIYDSIVPKLDEFMFINSLSDKYCVDRKSVIKRINDVRLINYYKENTLPEEKPKKKKFFVKFKMK